MRTISTMDVQHTVSEQLLAGHPRFRQAVIPTRTYIDPLEPRAYHVVLPSPLPMSQVARLEWSGHQAFRQGGMLREDSLSVFTVLEALRADNVSLWQVAFLGQAAFQAWERWVYLLWYRSPSLPAPQHLLRGVTREIPGLKREHGCIMARHTNLTKTLGTFRV